MKPAKRPTIKDVAAEAGVSAQAVSLVINDRPGVSDDTRAEIRRAIRKLNYTPRAWAQAMRGASTRTLGFVYAGTRRGRLSASGYLEEILNGALAAANQRGYHLLLYSLQLGDDHQFRDLAGRVDGLVSAVSDLTQPRLATVEELGLPIVEIQRDNPRAYTVVANDRGGVASAVAYLARRGHRRIGYLSRALTTYTSHARYEGYREGLRAQGLEHDEHLVRYAAQGRTDAVVISDPGNEHAEIVPGRELMLELLGQPEPPSAVICFDDLLAVGALRAARARGVAVPGELAVIGFNNFSLSAAVDPPLTTIQFPAYDLGARSTTLVIDHLEGRPSPERRIVLPVALVARATT